MKIGTDFTEGSVSKKFIMFVLPIIASSILQMVYTMADTAIVGKFAGKTALAAVGTTGSFSAIVLNLLLGLSVGANAVCARAYGAKNKENVSRIVHCAVLVSLISGIIICIIGELCSPICLRIMNTPSDVIDDAVLYIRIYFLGTPAIFVYNFSSAILRAGGDAKRPLYILLVTGALNIVLNLLFILVFGWGIAGVAWATVISQTLSATATVAILLAAKNEFRLRISKLRIYKNELLSMFKVGMPAGLTNMMYCIPGISIQSVLNTFGSAVVAGNTAATSVENVISLSGIATEQSCVSFVGQNVGAGKLKRIDSATKVALVFTLTVSIVLEIIILANKEWIMGFYTNDPDIAEAGYMRLFFCVGFMFLTMPSHVFGGCFNGLGRSVEPAVINAICICGIRMLWICTVCTSFANAVEVVYFLYPLTWFITSLVMMIAYLIVRCRIFSGIRLEGKEVKE